MHKLIGKRFDRLVVVDVAERKVTEARSYLYRLKTRCDCGATHLVWENLLRRQKTSMCEACRNAHTPIAQNPLSSMWGGMNSRCHDKNCPEYKNYGARGIVVCDRWRRVPGNVVASRRAFESFVADMGPRPEGWTIERNDVDGPYSPGNCRWAPADEQHLNKRSTRRVDGEPVALVEREYGLRVGAVSTVARKYGVPIEQVVRALKTAVPSEHIRWQQLLGVQRKPRVYTQPMKAAKPTNYHRYNFYLPPELVEEAKLMAKARGWSAAELVRRSMTAYMKALKTREVPRNGD